MLPSAFSCLVVLQLSVPAFANPGVKPAGKPDAQVGEKASPRDENAAAAAAKPQPATKASVDSEVKQKYLNADFAFHGRVKSVDFRTSTQAADGTRQPITFVTYEVLERLSDLPVEQKEVTLKFLGGWSGAKYISSAHAPVFNKDDEDIIFVQGDSRTVAPVSVENRFRILKDQIHSEMGAAYSTANNGELRNKVAIIESNYFTIRKIGDNAFIRYVNKASKKPADRLGASNQEDDEEGLPVIREASEVQDRADINARLTDANLNFLTLKQFKTRIGKWLDEKRSTAGVRKMSEQKVGVSIDDLEPFTLQQAAQPN
jgi:hypothetical protein